MDKNAIKKFAVWARRELISRVSQRAAWYGITEKDPIDEKLQAIHGHVLTPEEQAQRRALIWHIRKNGYQQVMEEVAYTWFNRFIALRFMEVNGYLPSYTRVFSDENGAFNPQILKDAIHLDIEGLDMEKVYAMEEANETEALFKYLVITQCNDLNRMLPGMFQKISDYTELLFPDFLLREGSVAHLMVTSIPEEDWKDAVQIIGWLYQYYNAEPKDEVFAALKKNIKISKEKIPAATQLFTPDWIVRYMVENSLGRLWVEGHPNDELKANWKYYLEEAPQELKVEAQLKKIRAEYAQIDPASILCADPCMGSGHILVYMFDVLMQIYLAYGYTTNEAVESIVRKNLWGMDIDDRAAQLAYFAVMMKAQQYDHRWLAKQVRHPVQPNVFALQDSGNWPTFERQMRQAFTHHPTLMEETSINTAKALFETFADAKEYGSIIQPGISLEELNMLENTLDEMAQKADLMDFVAQADAMTLIETLKPLIRQCRGLVQKYHAVVTNPPYMGSSNMNSVLQNYVKDYYPYSKSDLSTVMMECTLAMCRTDGFMSMINIPVWMFLSSFEDLRKSIIVNTTISCMVHPGRGIFGSDFGTTVFAIRKNCLSGYKGTYYRLFDKQGDVESCEVREQAFNERKGKYETDQSNFMIIPGCPIAYWISNYEIFRGGKLGEHIDARIGMVSGDNNRFLRLWQEVNFQNIEFSATPGHDPQKKKWYPLQKGGDFRHWYGNQSYVINWANDGDELKHDNYEGTRVRSHNYNGSQQFKEGITWNSITASKFHCRYTPSGFTFDAAGPLCEVTDTPKLLYILGFMSSKVTEYLFSLINPTVNFPSGYLESLPYIEGEIDLISKLAERCLNVSREDWDSFEQSWHFARHPLACGRLIHESYLAWEEQCMSRFLEIKQHEKTINESLIKTYGLQKELTADVADEDVTVNLANLSKDIRSLISYAVGCMFGRYCLDKPGLQFAGGDWNTYASRQTDSSYPPDKDGILPITDDEYFDDDIVGMFINWVSAVYGAETLEVNLKFIADALGGKGNPREVIRQYFLSDFYKDHCNTYSVTGSGKRPIYWLFDSGKKNGFKCLIYMHRYQPDTIARIRTDYLHETQARYRNAIETLERQSANVSTSERVKMTKQLNALKAQAEEARVYEEKIHHLADQMIKIDLDDGVKVNYAKFADVLAPIK